MKLNIVPYSLNLPADVKISVALGMGDMAHWLIEVGRFQFSIHLTTRNTPEYLADFILSCTKRKVELRPVKINGIQGVTYGQYNSGRSWMDWWLKKGDVMICINLQAYCNATPQEITIHNDIVNSLSYNL